MTSVKITFARAVDKQLFTDLYVPSNVPMSREIKSPLSLSEAILEFDTYQDFQSFIEKHDDVFLQNMLHIVSVIELL